MSLEALLENDSITVQTNAANITPDSSGGVPLDSYTDLYTGVPARVQDSAAVATSAFNVWGMAVTSLVFTKQSGIAEKHLIVTSDGRIKVVEGVQFRREIGNMPSFYVIGCSEYRPGA